MPETPLHRIDERRLSPAKRRILAALREHRYEPLAINWEPMAGSNGVYEGGFDVDGWGSWLSADELIQWLNESATNVGCLHIAQDSDATPDDVFCGFFRYHLIHGTTPPKPITWVECPDCWDAQPAHGGPMSMADVYRAYATAPAPQEGPKTRQLHAAVRAAFIEGYVQGVHHPQGRSVVKEAERIAEAFWQRVMDKATEQCTTTPEAP